MTEPKFDVLGIGNAIVDVIAKADEDFLVGQNLIKGSMRLVETTESERLYGLMGESIQMSGGSAGNTAAGVASFGGKAAFIGKVEGLGAATAPLVEQAFNAVLEELSLKMGQLMPVYRLCVAGRMQGPGMFDVSALLGREEVLVRLKAGLNAGSAWG